MIKPILLLLLMIPSLALASEFYPGDLTKTHAVALNANGSPITTGCQVSAFYPNATLFYNWTNAVYSTDGLWYYDKQLTNDTPAGIYPINWRCLTNTSLFLDVGGAHEYQIRESKAINVSVSYLFLILTILLILVALFVNVTALSWIAGAFSVFYGFSQASNSWLFAIVFIVLGLLTILHGIMSEE